jgi:hypothetical protein
VCVCVRERESERSTTTSNAHSHIQSKHKCRRKQQKDRTQTYFHGIDKGRCSLGVDRGERDVQALLEEAMEWIVLQLLEQEVVADWRN